MIELTEALQHALDGNLAEPVQVVDPRTNQTYVLVRKEAYERVKMILGGDDELDGLDVGALIAEAMREDDKNDPLLDSYQKYKSPS